ncbi:Ran GTPase-activating protein [Ceratobasidium theobromae]|uniref:Ran GTPase-activating protein n=1 Tax=Ceratobasidium theobromae TaxID=1582974 RepID=A0A5N5Q9V8_9AGAM|nr:Ran GTPase-activating protein [Ceratobasidium theobromae]
MASTTPSGTYAHPSKVFTIHGKALTLTTREDIEPYLKQLREIKDLEEVHFGGNTLGVEACKALAEVLKEVNTLKIADFHDIFTRRLISEIPQALSAICDALKDKTTLVELNLSDNAFGGRSAEPMVPFLTHNKHFQVFKLNNNGLGIDGGKIIAGALLANARAAKTEGIHPTRLRTVICGRNRLENGSASAWAEAFAAHGGLTEVRMPQNGIRMEGIAEISKGLSKCPSLQILDLQDNTCTESGSRAVAEALKAWPDLRTLNLSDCLLSPKGGIALATALREGRCRKLETLKVQYGEWDHRAINILAEAIQDKLPDLKTLELNGNRADPEDECISNIRDALESHGNADALDELDDMEEFDEEEAEREEEEAEVKRGDASEEEEEKGKEKGKESKAPSEDQKVDDGADSLAELMGKVRIGDYLLVTSLAQLHLDLNNFERCGLPQFVDASGSIDQSVNSRSAGLLSFTGMTLQQRLYPRRSPPRDALSAITPNLLSRTTTIAQHLDRGHNQPAQRVPVVNPPPGTNELADSIRKQQNGTLRALDTALLNSPQFTIGWTALATQVRYNSTVPGDIRELLILRVAALQGAAYEWQLHEALGRSEGLTSDQLKLIRDPVFSPYGSSVPAAFNLKQIAALKFTDASTKNSHVSDEVWSTLAGQFTDTQQITELALTVAMYNMVSRFLLAVSVDGVAELQVPYPQ